MPPLRVSPEPLELSLLGEFRLSVSGVCQVALPGGARRLLTLLALRNRTVSREVAAGTLWPDVSQVHASASLRVALCRLRSVSRWAVTATPHDITLAPDATVDIEASRVVAQQVMDPDYRPSRSDGWGLRAIGALSADILPHWRQEWLLFEAESWRQVRLRALEALAARLTAEERFADAAAAAMAAVAAEPLRETARASLIRVHLAEGNQSEAVREFHRYADQLREELGLHPTPRLVEVMRDHGASATWAPA